MSKQDKIGQSHRNQMSSPPSRHLFKNRRANYLLFITGEPNPITLDGRAKSCT